MVSPAQKFRIGGYMPQIFTLPPIANPNTSRWNMVTMGNIPVGVRAEHVNFLLFVSFPPALLPNANVVSGGIRA